METERLPSRAQPAAGRSWEERIAELELGALVDLSKEEVSTALHSLPSDQLSHFGLDYSCQKAERQLLDVGMNSIILDAMCTQNRQYS